MWACKFGLIISAFVLAMSACGLDEESSVDESGDFETQESVSHSDTLDESEMIQICYISSDSVLINGEEVIEINEQCHSLGDEGRGGGWGASGGGGNGGGGSGGGVVSGGGGPGEQPKRKECGPEQGHEGCYACCYYNHDHVDGWECRRKRTAKSREACWAKAEEKLGNCQRGCPPPPITAINVP